METDRQTHTHTQHADETESITSSAKEMGQNFLYRYDSGHAKRVLTYGEKWGNHDYIKINVSIVPMINYIFLERRGFPLSKNT